MKFGIVTSFGSVHDYVQMAREAEDTGWDGVFVWDDISVERGDVFDPWVVLGAMAAVTERVTLGAMVFSWRVVAPEGGPRDDHHRPSHQRPVRSAGRPGRDLGRRLPAGQHGRSVASGARREARRVSRSPGARVVGRDGELPGHALPDGRPPFRPASGAASAHSCLAGGRLAVSEIVAARGALGRGHRLRPVRGRR